MSVGLDQLRRYVGDLVTYLRHVGSDIEPEPAVVRHPDGDLSVEFVALLPGSGVPKPSEVAVAEVWTLRHQGLERIAYAYELIDHERDRRRAFHLHDPGAFLRRAGVLVHEHCEEALSAPACHHYFGLPVRNAYEAIERLLVAWSEPGPLGCDELRCMEG